MHRFLLGINLGVELLVQYFHISDLINRAKPKMSHATLISVMYDSYSCSSLVRLFSKN